MPAETERMGKKKKKLPSTINASPLPASLTNPTGHYEPWYESSLLWGSVSLMVSVPLTVIAAIVKDLRWLLWLAFPFGCLAAWAFARPIETVRIRRAVVGLSSILIATGLWWLGQE